MGNLPDFSIPGNFILTAGILFLIVTARFFLVAGIFHLVFYVWQKEKWQPFKIGKPADRGQFRKEMGFSFLSSIIFSLVITISLLLWQKGYTLVYLDIDQYGWAWLPLSLLISFIIHEVYYYWAHRWMHRPKIFRYVHSVHHSSRIPTPWTAFSFHPLESLLISLVFPFVIMILPMHPVVIVTQLVLMTVSSVINHLDIDIFPEKISGTPLAKLMIGSEHHSRHHSRVNYNYGLHFTFLDKIHGTESPAIQKKIPPAKPAGLSKKTEENF
jgi:lathosterol oxidase